MFNGRPRGRGVLLWSNGTRVCGTADGTRLTAAASAGEEAACEAAAAAGRDCAEAAQAVQQQAVCGAAAGGVQFAAIGQNAKAGLS